MATAAAHKAPPAGDNLRPLITEADLKDEFAPQIAKLQEIVNAAHAAVPPVFEDDDDLTQAKEQAPKLRGAWKRLEDLRKERKKVFDSGGDTVHDFFKALQKLVTDVETAQNTAATNYLRKKAAAAQAAQLKKEAEDRAEAERLRQAAVDQAKAGHLSEAVTTQAASEKAATRADDAASLASGKPADLARTTTSAGTATLEDRYDFTIEDTTQLDVFKLQPYFLDTEIKAAIARAVKAGVRELRGVKIFAAPKARL